MYSRIYQSYTEACNIQKQVTVIFTSRQQPDTAAGKSHTAASKSKIQWEVTAAATDDSKLLLPC